MKRNRQEIRKELEKNADADYRKDRREARSDPGLCPEDQ